MVKKAKKSSKKPSCSLCQSADLTEKISNYSARPGGPWGDMELYVKNIEVFECGSCGHLTPTQEGQRKVDRSVAMLGDAFRDLRPPG